MDAPGVAVALVTRVRRPRTRRRRVRELAAGEVDTLRAVFAGMSPASRARRFHGPVGDELSPTVLARLADVGPGHRAVVAEHRDDTGWWVPIGIARFAALGPGQAEVAVAVVDRWQGRGVGTQLLRELRVRALADGIDRLVAHVHRSNLAAVRAGRHAFPGARAVEGEDVVRYEVELGADPGHLTVDDLLDDLLRR